MRPLVSVIMATYGRGAHIRPSIASALRQTCRDFELIVVGDGCGGGYMTMVHPDNIDAFEPGALFATNRSNKGLARPALRRLDQYCYIEQTAEPRALDWYPIEQGVLPFRWSGRTPGRKFSFRSRILARRASCCIVCGQPPALPVSRSTKTARSCRIGWFSAKDGRLL